MSRASTVRSALVSGDVIFRHIGSEPWAKQAKTNSRICTTHYKTTERRYPAKIKDHSSISKWTIVVELIIMVTPGGSHRCLFSMIRDLPKKDYYLLPKAL